MAYRLLFLITLILTLGAPAIVVADRGQATYYGPVYVPSACYGYNTSMFPAENLFAAASYGLYNNKEACGKYYTVTCTRASNGGPNPCTGGSVTVMVVDLCPGCSEPGIDLSSEAFSRIANLDAGRIDIEFNRV